jgi:hypothetical protein
MIRLPGKCFSLRRAIVMGIENHRNCAVWQLYCNAASCASVQPRRPTNGGAAAIEPLGQSRQQSVGVPGARVGDHDRRRTTIALDTHLHGGPRRAVAQRVVDQVAQCRTEQIGVAGHVERRRWPR